MSSEVIPFRPHTGIFLIVEEPTDPEAQDDYRQSVHTQILPALVEVPGVAGAWAYATTPSVRRPMFSDGDRRITVCYLDDDPASVAGRLAPVLGKAWSTAPVRPLLAAPFESLMVPDRERFGPSPG